MHLRRQKRGLFDKRSRRRRNHTRQNRPSTPPGRYNGKKLTAGKVILRALGMIMTFVLAVVIILGASLKMICSDISPAAKNTFVTTILETGKLKFLANIFVDSDEVKAIVDANTMTEMEDEVDGSLISIGGGGEISGDISDTTQKDIEVIEVSGRTFYGNMIIVKDPSRISLASIYPWRDQGVNLDELVKGADAVAGINGGLYNSGNNSGGRPYGIVVANGEIQLNEPQSFPGLVLIGFDEDNILQIIDVDGMTPAESEAIIKEKRIRDAVTFQEDATDKNNHFVKLVINGNARELNGAGSGLNPRTCIGQRADGSVLMLVTDGRGKSGHLGASASDLIGVMMEYGAVNAANLDGGSSSSMYYEGEYLMTSVTFYYSNESWRMPVAFVVK
ncbi:MAG: phosphodiester glycosidase family protein [Ruminococcaceae bacterium]|nr:phosphodiester glycosidase family protein [Oscillospiraceae bacterium]